MLIKKISKEEYEAILDLDNKEFENADLEMHKTYSHNKHHGESFEKDLVFTGLLGIMDPPRAEAIEAISDCQKAGINVVMITGDHKDTATAIAKEIGILNESDDGGDYKEVLTGQELEDLSDEEYMKIAKDIKVYARVYPEQKKDYRSFTKSWRNCINDW